MARHGAAALRTVRSRAAPSPTKTKEHKFETYLPAIGVLSIEELEGVRPLPLVAGVEVFLGVEEPKPTGVCL